MSASDNVIIKIDNGEDEVVVTNQDSQQEIQPTKQADDFFRSEQQIKMGKKLTQIGLGSFTFGVLCAGGGFVTGLMALYVATNSFSLYGISSVVSMALYGTLNLSAGFYALVGVTLALWAMSPFFMGMIFLIIPGIIQWARGSNLKKKISTVSLNDSLGFAFAVKL
jgi:hypothetical protein